MFKKKMKIVCILVGFIEIKRSVKLFFSLFFSEKIQQLQRSVASVAALQQPRSLIPTTSPSIFSNVLFHTLNTKFNVQINNGFVSFYYYNLMAPLSF